MQEIFMDENKNIIVIHLSVLTDMQISQVIFKPESSVL